MVKALARINRALEHSPLDPCRTADRELLRRYADDGDEAAFGVLVRRYSRLVLGVCRHVGVSGSDAEDVCQAVFLVLSRKAKGGRWRPSIANWLYATARNLARNARTAAARRTTRERKAAVPESVGPIDALTGRELLDALAEELDRLPAIYREPLILAFLDGLTRDEIASRLEIPAPTVKTRLERGKKRLGDALTRRGVADGFALLALAATSQVGLASTMLVDSILAVAGGSPSPAVAALAQGISVNGITKRALAVVLALGAVAAGFAALPVAAESQKSAEKMTKSADKPGAKADAPKPAERTLTGTVLGADGKPVLADLVFASVEAKPVELGRTKADGTFRVTVPLTVKEHGGWLIARAPGHGTDFQPSGMEYLPQTMTPTAELTLRLPKLRP
ncbi:MAG TPA: sigma-70 family RNA polymerase sigma factor, partial [Gemmataceae bacterium]|nr:sigma-70 family RNA polymerase sigma factor [Gemmataceae bacterium]